MITLTESAAKQIKVAARQTLGDDAKAIPTLRVAVKQDADGNFQYAMGFDTESEDDIVTRSQGCILVALPAYVERLNGLTIDYVELKPDRFEFIFLNPNDPGYVPPQHGA